MSSNEQAPVPAQRKRLWWIIGAAALVVVIIVAIVFAVTSSQSSPTPVRTSTSASTAPTPNATPSESAEPTPAESTPAAGPLPFDEPGVISEGLTVRVASVEAVEGEAQGPGESAGPALRFTVVISNATDQSAELGNTVANLFYGETLIPGSALSGPGVQAFPVAIGAGEEATAVYVFGVPVDQRGFVQLSVDYSADTTDVVFEGPAPTE